MSFRHLLSNLEAEREKVQFVASEMPKSRAVYLIYHTTFLQRSPCVGFKALCNLILFLRRIVSLSLPTLGKVVSSLAITLAPQIDCAFRMSRYKIFRKYVLCNRCLSIIFHHQNKILSLPLDGVSDIRRLQFFYIFGLLNSPFGGANDAKW